MALLPADWPATGRLGRCCFAAVAGLAWLAEAWPWGSAPSAPTSSPSVLLAKSTRAPVQARGAPPGRVLLDPLYDDPPGGFDPEPAPQSRCAGRESQSAQCKQRACGDCIPLHCKFSEWGAWRPFGGCTGLGVRRRHVITENNECGRPCVGPIEETVLNAKFNNNSCQVLDQDCEWGAWSEWSHCRDCNNCGADRLLQKTRHREVRKEASGAGNPCGGIFNQTVPCGFEVPIDCQWMQWSDWTLCSASCDGGWRAHMRRFKRHAQFGGMPCEGEMRETSECNTQQCGDVQDCEVGPWSDWDGCVGFKVERNRHQMLRQRSISKYAYNGGDPCDSALKETMACPEGKMIDWCTYSEWSEWSECPVTCNGGHQERLRHFRGDKHCKSLEVAPLRQIKGCNRKPCEENCVLSSWSEWSECSQSCGQGVSERSRALLEPAVGEESCQAVLGENKGCLLRSCPVFDCQWAEWEPWGSCSSACGGGIKRRVRNIAQPPLLGGEQCSAEDKIQIEPCNKQTCEDCVDGVWSTWSIWSGCSATCFPAYRSHSRSLRQKANHCGRQASGPADEFELCSELPRCEAQQDCRLSQWSAWSPCSSGCFGVTERHRDVEQTASLWGKACTDKAVKEVEGCNPSRLQDVPTECLLNGPAPCTYTTWGEWSECSATCDSGQKTRARRMLVQGASGGAGCQGTLSEMVPCNTESCDPNRHCEDCIWGQWLPWSACFVCGGQQYRQRSVERPPNWCGTPCDKSYAKETQLCQQVCEKAYCTWSQWQEKDECSSTCGTATKARTRTLNLVLGNPAADEDVLMVGTMGMACDGLQTDQALCEYVSCDPNCPAQDCVLGSWNEWGEPSCDQLCTRTRLINQLNQCNGAACNGTLLETKPCRKDCGEVLNCVLGEWGGWSACQAHQSFRERAIQQAPENGGLPCPKLLHETKTCDTDYSPRDCAFSDWADWSQCTKLCGGGHRERVRGIKSEAANGGTACNGDVEELEACRNEPCTVGEVHDCVIGAWTEWTPCDSYNQRKRHRIIDLHAEYRGAACNGTLHEVAPCFTAMDCIVSPWAAWDDCDRSCGGGQHQRQRQVVRNPRNGGRPCPEGLVSIQGCNQSPCPTNSSCEMSNWAPWSDCSVTCGVGFQERTREVIKERESYCIPGCHANLTLVRPCADLPKCGGCKSCQWGQWELWTSCSKGCGGGQHHRSRNISRHPEAGCGTCEPKDKVYTEPCNTRPCSDDLCIDGQWNDWQDWSTCSTSCEGGLNYRIRTVRQHKNACGKPAEGKDREEGRCMEDVPCVMSQDCQFGEWGAWTDCSASCAGIKKRSRVIAVHGHGKDAAYCEGALNETEPCAFGRQSSLLDWTKPNLYMNLDRVASNNLGGEGPATGDEPNMRFWRVAMDPGGGTWLDLLIRPNTSRGRNYIPASPVLNGKQGVFGSINLHSDTLSDIDFDIVESGTSKPVVVDDLLLKFFDLDEGTENTAHTVMVHGGCEEYYTSERSRVIAKGHCGTEEDEPVAFRKPIVAEPGCDPDSTYDLDLSRVSLSNLAGKGPDHHQPSQELRYTRVAVINGVQVDLIIELQPGNHYEPGRAISNGYNGRFGVISLLPDAQTSHFTARFVNPATQELFPIPKLNWTFFDIDQPNNVVREKVEAVGFQQWYYPNGLMKWRGALAWRKKDSGATLFSSTKIDVADPVYPEPLQLTPEQDAATLTLFYENTAQIGFGLHVTQTGPAPGVERDRHFLFGGKYCVPMETRRLSGQVPPAHGQGLQSWESDAPTPGPGPSPQPGPAFGFPNIPLPGVDLHLPNLLVNGVPSFSRSGGSQSSSSAASAPAPPPLPPVQEVVPLPAPVTSADCPNGPVRSDVEYVGPASLTPAQERRSVAVRFRGTSHLSLTLGVNKGSCGHNFLFAAKICVSGACDPCAGVSGCRFSVWQEWSHCTAECGGGHMNRTREVVRVAKGDIQVAECAGPMQTVRSCNVHSCSAACRPQDCKWDDWSDWTQCTKCGGRKVRQRGIAQMPVCGGLPCKQADSEEIDTCEQDCVGKKTFCTWEHWSPWTDCSVTCGCGKKTRTRRVSMTVESADRPNFQVKFQELDELKERVQAMEGRRLRVNVASFAVGCLVFSLALAAVRSRWLRAARVAPEAGLHSPNDLLL